MQRRHIAVTLFSMLLLFLAAFAPRFAAALPEGRTLDEGHDSGYIDWSGSVAYEDLLHRDALCWDCIENVTRINGGSSVSGAFRGGVEVDYFEIMVARSGAGGYGTAILTACSSTTSVFLGSGGATPGFNSVSLYVPPGCGSWSLAASGGVVYFRSVDANYSAPPLPPVITGSVACAQPGSGGWCLGGQSLHLEASDPQSQPVIMYGKISGVDFSCAGGAAVCDVPITIEGAGLAEFTVLNPATGLSDSDSLPYQLDATTPQLDLTLSGASGLGGWFVSAMDVSASASDAVFWAGFPGNFPGRRGVRRLPIPNYPFRRNAHHHRAGV